MSPLSRTACISLIALFNCLHSQSSDNDTLPTLQCLISNDGTDTESCYGYCGSTTVETIFIGVEDPDCPLPPDYIPSINTSTSKSRTNSDASMTTTEANEDKSCINENIGCGTSWLCSVLIEDKPSSCSSADFLMSINQLVCVADPENDGNTLYTTNKQYTQFKINQFCCNSNQCTINDTTTCSYSEPYEAYTSDLFHCLYSENAVNNRFKQISQCNATFDSNSYQDTCDYLVSRTYSIFGCKCKSSFLMGHEYAEDNDNVQQMIADWNSVQLDHQLLTLQEYGCASNLYCIPNDDEVFTGGLLGIEQILFTIECNVYLPYSLIDENVIEDIEEKIETEVNRIYVTFDTAIDHDETAEGRYVNVLVIYFDQEERDNLQKQLVSNKEYFGEGSVVSDVEGFNINDTLTYYGATRYYPRVIRDENAALIGTVIFSFAIEILLIVLAIVYRRNSIYR